MRPPCPRDYLQHQTPRERAEEKARLVCAWLAIMGHSTEPILRTLLAIKAKGVCARLQRAGLVRKVSVPLASVAVWALTALGVRVAETALARPVKYLTHPERLTLSLLTHEIAVQHEALARLPTDLAGLRRIRADRELRSMNSLARPDLLVRQVDQDGIETTACIEVEINTKSDRELRAKMRAIMTLITPRTLWLRQLSPSAALAGPSPGGDGSSSSCA